MKTAAAFALCFTLALLSSAFGLNPIESELFPPEFLAAQHEALGLSEAQIKTLQAVVGEVGPQFDGEKSKLEGQMAALEAELKKEKIDGGAVEEKLRAMLQKETEMKMLQFHTLIKLREMLTPEQVAKARQLRQQAPAKGGAASVVPRDPKDGLIERLQGKFKQLKIALDTRAFGGESPDKLAAEIAELTRLAREGEPLEAERRIDALIERLHGGKGK